MLHTPSDRPLHANGWHQHNYPIIQLREEFRNLYRLVEVQQERIVEQEQEIQRLWETVNAL